MRAKFTGKGGRPPTKFWRGVVCVILRLAVLIQYRRVTHTHTRAHTHPHTHRHAIMAITRAELAPRG